MSTWRRIALEKIPSLNKIIKSKDIDSIGTLWIELCSNFNCKNFQIMTEIFNYANWCLKESNNPDIQTTVLTHFYESLLNNSETRKELPRYITKEDFVNLKEVFLYHNSEQEYEVYKKEFWTNWEKICEERLKNK